MIDTKQMLAKHGIRCTKQRQEIYDALAACKTHPTAEQLHQLVNDTTPGTSLATIYNTLDTLTKSGLCRRIPTPGGGARFDADMSDHLHVVTSDGRLIDVPDDLGRRVAQSLPRDVIRRIGDELGIDLGRVSIHLHAE
ncbi:MAG: transcriptional repressor [Phycisphaerales bacterium]